MPVYIPRKPKPKLEPWELAKVISGAQDGADIAGLRAAKLAGIPTGGFMPLGFLTHGGMRPEYAEEFGVVEHPMAGYRNRTWENVNRSDGTIRFAYRWNSAGEICTLNAIHSYSKPYFDVHPNVASGDFCLWSQMDPKAARRWIIRKGIRVLNVAGNSDVHLEPFVESYLAELFELLKGDQ